MTRNEKRVMVSRSTDAPVMRPEVKLLQRTSYSNRLHIVHISHINVPWAIKIQDGWHVEARWWQSFKRQLPWNRKRRAIRLWVFPWLCHEWTRKFVLRNIRVVVSQYQFRFTFNIGKWKTDIYLEPQRWLFLYNRAGWKLAIGPLRIANKR